MLRRRTALALALTATTCRPPEVVEPPRVAAPPRATVPAPAPAKDARDSLQLIAAAHHAALTAVFLDEQGRSAVTLDADGEARLWPDVRAETSTAPWVLPLRPSVAVSLARSGVRDYVVAALDADGMARIGRIEVGAGAARWTTVIDGSPESALREVHVLADDRIVTLSHNYEVSVYTHSGEWLANRDAPDFFPQQLRVVAVPGRSPTIVAVFADPLRAQTLAVDGDALVLRAAPHRLDLERMPACDELVLTPDGASLVVSHRRGPGRGFLLERIDIATDERRWMSGELDRPDPPRVHVADATHLLLESGPGEALWLDFSVAAVDRARAGGTARRRGPVPGSAAAWPTSAVAGGLRALVDGAALIVDDLSVEHHLRIAPAPFRPAGVALDADGGQVAWIVGDRLIVERVGDPGPPRTNVRVGRTAQAVVFAGSTRLLVVDARGEVTLHRSDDGATIATHRARGPGVAEVVYRARGEQRGELAWVDRSGATGLVLTHEGDTLGAPRSLGASDRETWPALMRPAPAERRRLAARLAVASGDIVHAADTGGAARYIAAGDRLIRLEGAASVAVRLARGGVRELKPAGRRVAVVERGEHEAFVVLSVYEFSGDSGRRRWSRALATAAVDMQWSGDGRRLAVAGAVGLVLDADSGADLLVRGDLGITVRRSLDAATGRSP